MAIKGRPKKVRYIQKMPKVVQFSPRGKPGRPDEVELRLDEFEAIKLADHQGCDHQKGAAAMRISRPSFGRILRGARKKLADAIVNGKIIKIRMGDAQVGVKRMDISGEPLSEEVVRFRAQSEKMLRSLERLREQEKADNP